MECPKCGNEIGQATYCGCGWKRKAIGKDKETIPDETKKCAYDVCFMSARVKVKTPTGWANLCLKHYHEHHDKQSRDYCAALGLHTPAQMRQWLRGQALLKKANVVIREPGQDDEWRESA